MRASGGHRATGFGGSCAATFELLRRRALPAAVGAWALAFAGLLASAAQAEEVFTSQSAAARGTDATWIAAPAQPAALCIVDTGNDPNPDTTNVIARLAVDGGDGGDLDTTGHHGTLMSMIASAPYNGFGMVGAAPSVKVVSVRATRAGNGGGFAFSDVLQSIELCRNQRSVYNIKVVSLSLGIRNDGPLDSVAARSVREAVDRARQSGLNVVAAAGNHPGAVDYPAAYAPVVAVAAADDAGMRCAFAASGAEVDLSAPGCPQDVAMPDGRAAWASGSSESTAYVAASLAEMRALRPELSVDEAEGFLTSSARAGVGGPQVDVAAAFHAAGLEAELAQGHTRIPRAAPQTTPGSADASSYDESVVSFSGPVAHPPVGLAEESTPHVDAPSLRIIPAEATDRNLQLPRPRVRTLRYRRGVLTLVLRNRPLGAQVEVQIYARKRDRRFPTPLPRVRIIRDRLRTYVSGKLSQVSITYRDPTDQRRTSPPLTRRP